MNKKRLQKGETLTETLAAILISALSSALLLTAVMASSKVNKQTEEADLALREQQIAAEEQINGKPDTVRVGRDSYPVLRYGEDGQLQTYVLNGGGTP